MPNFLVAGFFKNVEQMPWVFRWLSYLSFLRYSWESYVLATFLDLPGATLSGASADGAHNRSGGPPATTSAHLTGEDVLRERLAIPQPSEALFWQDIAILFSFTIVFRLLAFFFLSRRVR